MSHSGTGQVVSFGNVSKHYGSLRAVDGLSLGLRPGETAALLGPNGAGKSTSLDMLLALRKPASGRIRMFGDDPFATHYLEEADLAWVTVRATAETV